MLLSRNAVKIMFCSRNKTMNYRTEQRFFHSFSIDSKQGPLERTSAARHRRTRNNTIKKKDLFDILQTNTNNNTTSTVTITIKCAILSLPSESPRDPYAPPHPGFLLLSIQCTLSSNSGPLFKSPTL